MSNDVSLKTVIDGAQERFIQVCPAGINFESEKSFAIQLLQNSPTLLAAAMDQPKSLQHAVSNVASIGLSLNPAKKQAYLIPRTVKVKDEKGRDQYKKKIFLEPSYMGMCDLATMAGVIEWIECRAIREKDKYVNNGPGRNITHEYSAFSDRGKIIGFTSVAKTTKGDYLVTELDMERITNIMYRSESVKYAVSKNKPITGPWATDFEEQGKKTTVRNQFKMLPKAKELDRLSQAVNISNENEGFEPIITEPQLKEMSSDQKMYFDGLIESSSNMEMYVFERSLVTDGGEHIWSNLYNSFPKGSKGKYQTIVEQMLKTGRDIFEEMRLNLMASILEERPESAREIFEGINETTVNMLKDSLDCEHSSALSRMAV